MLDNNAVLIFRAWATCVLTYTYPILGIHAWWKGVVKSKMAVTDRKYRALWLFTQYLPQQ